MTSFLNYWEQTKNWTEFVLCRHVFMLQCEGEKTEEKEEEEEEEEEEEKKRKEEKINK